MEPLIQRLAVCRHTGQISPALVDALMDALRDALPVAKRRQTQHAILRKAASLLEGSPWQRAEQLSAIIARWSGHGGDPIRMLLVEASRVGIPLPTSPRHVYRIISSD